MQFEQEEVPALGLPFVVGYCLLRSLRPSVSVAWSLLAILRALSAALESIFS